jgi:hypothetical protein
VGVSSYELRAASFERAGAFLFDFFEKLYVLSSRIKARDLQFVGERTKVMWTDQTAQNML